MLLRWYRRCILLSALDQRVLTDPVEKNGGSFTGPSVTEAELRRECDGHALQHCDDGCPPWWIAAMDGHVDEYLRVQDALPFHFQMHLMHAVEILGYKHPDHWTRTWWNGVYVRLVNSLHLHPESLDEMNDRLGDDRSGWLRRADPATAT
jgi:hypothetical protein